MAEGKAGAAPAEGQEEARAFRPGLLSVGTYLRQSNLHVRRFKPILTRAELPDMRVYDLRHSAATILLALGENAKVVQERLGHSTMTLPMDTYSPVLEVCSRWQRPGSQRRLVITRKFRDHLVNIQTKKAPSVRGPFLRK